MRRIRENKRSRDNVCCPACGSYKARKDWSDPKKVFCPECGLTSSLYKGGEP